MLERSDQVWGFDSEDSSCRGGSRDFWTYYLLGMLFSKSVLDAVSRPVTLSKVSRGNGEARHTEA